MTCGMLGALFQLIKVENNGGAIVSAVTYKGSLDKQTSTVNCTSFLDLYLSVPGKLPTNADYEHKHAMISPDWQITECSSKITMGLGLLAREIGQVNVIARETPTKRVFACQAFGKGACVLVPVGAGIKAVDKSSTTHHTLPLHAALKCEGDLCATHSFHLGAAPGDVVVPALFVQSTSKVIEANMKISMFDVTLCRKSGAGKPESSKVSLPVFVNHKAIKEGDELIYFMENRWTRGPMSKSVPSI